MRAAVNARLVGGRGASYCRCGASVKTVQAMLGHKSTQETLDTYSHLWPDSDEQALTILNAARALLRQADGKLSVRELS